MAGPESFFNVADSRIDELRRRLERDPGTRLFAQLAEEHRKAGDLAEAIRVARAGLEQHPVYPSARLTLGRALLDSGDGAGARQELEQALHQAPDNILASRFLAQALEALGDFEGALQQYSATLKMAPGDPQLAAHVNELRARLAAQQPVGQAPTGPMPRMTPPPLPLSARVGAAPAPTIRLSPVTKRTAEESSRPPAAVQRSVPPELGASTLPRATNPPELGGATLPATARPSMPAVPTSRPPAAPAPSPAATADLPPPPPRPAELAATDGGTGAAPFSSSTLAELYLQQGMQERAVEVYRQVLAEDPGNERARTRLAALQSGPAASSSAPDPRDDRAARRRAIERTIAGLERLLQSIRRR